MPASQACADFAARVRIGRASIELYESRARAARDARGDPSHQIRNPRAFTPPASRCSAERRGSIVLTEQKKHGSTGSRASARRHRGASCSGVNVLREHERESTLRGHSASERVRDKSMARAEARLRSPRRHPGVGVRAENRPAAVGISITTITNVAIRLRTAADTKASRRTCCSGIRYAATAKPALLACRRGSGGRRISRGCR
jgi:hypothetical protein